MTIELKIKNKHLSQEAKIIRFEELKLKKHMIKAKGTEYENGFLEKRMSLEHHRKWDVRNENRATFLARAYLNGKKYYTVEQKRLPENEHVFIRYILPRVLTMVKKYGSGEQSNVTMDALKEWVDL